MTIIFDGGSEGLASCWRVAVLEEVQQGLGPVPNGFGIFFVSQVKLAGLGVAAEDDQALHQFVTYAWLAALQIATRAMGPPTE